MNGSHEVLHIGWMLGRHVPGIEAIEAQSHPVPMNRRNIRRANRKWKWMTMVASQPQGDGECVVGYLTFVRRESLYVIQRFAVDLHRRGEGIGAILLDRLEERLGDRMKAIEVRVPETCLGMQTFLRHRGYFCSRVDRGVWSGDQCARDCYVFSWGGWRR